MKSLSTALWASLLAIGLTIAGCSSRVSDEGDAGWITLLDGSNPKTLDNWNRIGDANWRAEDGAIVADKGKGGHLVSKNSYKDFQIRAEFWADPNTNSGIFFRISDPKSIGSKTGYEANIYDERPGSEYGTGAITNVAKVSPMPKAGGKWNIFEITARGSHLTLVLNGIKTVDVQHTQFTEGPISLQFGNREKGAPGGPIKWRKVQIRTL
jgi:3-keto-disaccharide hydrolase